MVHDRIHAREPSHDPERWTRGVVREVSERDGHAVVAVETPTGETTDLVVTVDVRDLFLRRLDLADGESPEGETVWYRKKRS